MATMSLLCFARKDIWWVQDLLCWKWKMLSSFKFRAYSYRGVLVSHFHNFLGEFPGGPVVPGWGTKIPQAAQHAPCPCPKKNFLLTHHQKSFLVLGLERLWRWDNQNFTEPIVLFLCRKLIFCQGQMYFIRSPFYFFNINLFILIGG